MTDLKPTLKRTVLGIVLVSLIGCPLTFAARVTSVGSAPLAQSTIDFEPSIEPLNTEEPPEEFLLEELVLPEAFVEGDVLVINGKPYPIGDAFYDAEGIPLGVRVTDRAGLFGYAPIANLPDHVLLWYLDGRGRRQYLITTADDPLIVGRTGFDQAIQDLKDAEDRLAKTLGYGTGALATAVLIQLAICIPSGGASCASAAITTIVGAAGATITAVLLIAFDLIPAMNNVKRAFTTLDTNRP